MSKWPTDSKQIMIEAFYQDGGDPFVCGVNGHVTVQAITDIESEIKDYSEDHFTKGDGSYLFEASFDAGEYEFGCCIHAPYWELTLIDFRPMDCSE
jgi:hypothetical protein